MTKDEFRAQLRALDITCDQFAAIIGRSLSTVYDFGERYPVPYYARVMLRLLAERGGTDGILPRMD